MSDHPTVQAAAQALSRVSTAAGFRLREQRSPMATAAVVAAFRERAEHVQETCDVLETYEHDGVSYTNPCESCTEKSELLFKWADEIEGASRD